MERTLNTEEALKILKECYITDSVQTLRKWIREGKIIAAGSPFKQEGYTIKEADLKAFIEEERPGFLDILKVYHQVNDRLPIGIASIVNQQELRVKNKNETPNIDEEEKMLKESNSNELGTIFEILLELEQQIKGLQVNIENVSKGVNDYTEIEKRLEIKIEQMKKEIKNDVMIGLKSQKNVTKPKTEKDAQGGNHKTKSEVDFAVFLRKEFWNFNPELGKLKGEVHKKFKGEARSCYSLFYDEDGQFRDIELKSEINVGFELTVLMNNQELIIKGQNRKELMKQYFENVFLPKMLEEKVPANNTRIEAKYDNAEDEKDDAYFETINLAEIIKSEEKKKAETKI